MYPVEIVPYNKVLYNNCLYNTLLTACQQLGIDDTFLLVNDFFTYKLCNNNNYFIIDRDVIKFKPDLVLLEEAGINCVTYTNDDDSLTVIRENLLAERMVLVCIDQFEYEKSPFYGKTHSVYHMLLYRQEEDVYFAVALMEGQCVNTSISEKEITAGLLSKRCFFSEYIPDFDLLVLSRNEKVKQMSILEARNTYDQNLKSCNNELMDRACLFKMAAKYYITYDFMNLEGVDLMEYPHAVTHMIIAKKVQQYLNNVLFNDNISIKNNLECALKNMRMLLADFTKLQVYKNLKRKPDEISQRLYNHLFSLYDLEMKYINLMLAD